jgi:hypothetical protein
MKFSSLFSQKSLTPFHLGYATIIIILILIIYVLKINYHKNEAVSVPSELLFKVLKPGRYTGTSTYSPTEIYKNGLRCQHEVNITNTHNDDLEVINNVTAYDQVTNKLAYSGVRKVKFKYKENHNHNLFKISYSYINNKLVSSSYGYATGKTDNSLSFNLSGSWHISNKDYHNIYNTITRTDTDTINTKFIHISTLGFHDMVMDEKYTMN